MVSQPNLSTMLGVQPDGATERTETPDDGQPAVFETPGDLEVARLAHAAIRRLENQPGEVPSITHLQKPEVQAALVSDVASHYRPSQLVMEGVVENPDIETIVTKAAELAVQQTIAIPRIVVLPKSEIKSGFKPFTLDLSTIKYQAPSDELWIQHLRTEKREIVGLGKPGMQEDRLEDYVVGGLVDFDDVAYDDHADLLYDLAGQVVAH
ncbi:MAG: type III restriction endonuclease subunit R, partial [Dehalococcoidia bacterium]